MQSIVRNVAFSLGRSVRVFERDKGLISAVVSVNKKTGDRT